jgi:hypothetical protein
MHTRDWWDLERGHFILWSSLFTERELGEGVYRRQADCLTMVRRLRFLPITAEVTEFIEQIVRRRLVPAKKGGDAAHLAIAAVHGVDYLLTWNYAHMANPQAQAGVAKLCDDWQLVVPYMVSPESIPQVRFGKKIRRSR